MARKPRPLQRGDLVKVTWADVLEDVQGNTDAATWQERTSYGVFWKQGPIKGIDCLVTTTTIDPHGPDDQGWVCYPQGIVLKVEVVKRTK